MKNTAISQYALIFLKPFSIHTNTSLIVKGEGKKRKHSEAAKDAKVEQSSLHVYGKVRETIRPGTSMGVDSEFLSTYLFEPTVMWRVCVYAYIIYKALYPFDPTSNALPFG